MHLRYTFQHTSILYTLFLIFHILFSTESKQIVCETHTVWFAHTNMSVVCDFLLKILRLLLHEVVLMQCYKDWWRKATVRGQFERNFIPWLEWDHSIATGLFTYHQEVIINNFWVCKLANMDITDKGKTKLQCHTSVYILSCYGFNTC